MSDDYTILNYANATHWRRESESRVVLVKSCKPVLSVEEDEAWGMWVIHAPGGEYRVSKADAYTFADAVERAAKQIDRDCIQIMGLTHRALHDGDLAEKEVRPAAVDVFTEGAVI